MFLPYSCSVKHYICSYITKGIDTVGASAVGMPYASSLYNDAEFTLTLTGQAKYTALGRSTNRVN